MLEPNNPEIDVDALMDRVRHEVLERRPQSAGVTSLPDEATDGSFAAAIAAAAERGGPRASWPARLAFFPFTLPAVQRAGVRALNGLFRNQLAFNAATVEALRRALAHNARLEAELRELTSRLELLERRERSG